MIPRFVLVFLLFAASSLVNADCVEGAKNKTKFNRLNTSTIALTGGYGSPIIIKTNCKIKRSSQIEIVLDSFCDAAESVLYVDGNECDVEHVFEDDKFNEDKLSDGDDWDFGVD